MRIGPALKGRNNVLVHVVVVPFQGVAVLDTVPRSPARGWHVVPFQGEIQEAQHHNLRFRLVSPVPAHSDGK